MGTPKRKYKTSPKVGQGKRGLPRSKGSGTQPGDMVKNTRQLLHAIKAQMAELDDQYGMTLMQTAYQMIHDSKTQDFVKKDLILGLLRLITPSMKAIDLSADKPVAAIQFYTNIGPSDGNGNHPDQLQGAQDLPSIPH